MRRGGGGGCCLCVSDNPGLNYLFVDLGALYTIDYIELINRLDCCSREF